MDPDQVVQAQSTPSSRSQGGEFVQILGIKTSLETKVGQLEVKVDLLKERIEAHLELRKWFFLITLTAIGIFFGFLYFIFNYFGDSMKSYRALEEGYYKELTEVRRDMRSQDDAYLRSFKKELESFSQDLRSQSNTIFEPRPKPNLPGAQIVPTEVK